MYTMPKRIDVNNKNIHLVFLSIIKVLLYLANIFFLKIEIYTFVTSMIATNFWNSIKNKLTDIFTLEIIYHTLNI
jgi:hypothetical protein